MYTVEYEDFPVNWLRDFKWILSFFLITHLSRITSATHTSKIFFEEDLGKIVAKLLEAFLLISLVVLDIRVGK